MKIHRSMAVQREVMLLQKLPAKQHRAFKARADVLTVQDQINNLTSRIGGRPTDHPELFHERQKLYGQKGKLRKGELKRYKDSWHAGNYKEEVEQTRNATDTPPPPIAPRSKEIFSLARRFMPTQDQLASSLFVKASIHTTHAVGVLKDLVSLCMSAEPVAYQKNEEPINGHCPLCNISMER